MPPKSKDQPVLPAEEFKAPAWWPQIVPMAEQYIRDRDARIEASVAENESKDLLIENLKFHNGGVLPVGEFDYDGLSFELVAENIKLKHVRMEDKPFVGSDPNQPALDGTIHDDEDEDADEQPSALREDLTEIANRNAENLAEE